MKAGGASPANACRRCAWKAPSPKTVDTVADIGKNKAAAFWFDAKDINGDGKIEIVVDAGDAGRRQEHDSQRPLGLPGGHEGRQPGLAWPAS